MNRASRGRVLRVPPYRFDLAVGAEGYGNGVFYNPPSPDAGRRIAELYTDGPILYSRNMVRAIDTRHELVAAGDSLLSDAYGFRPGTMGRGGYVVRVPKLVVVVTGLVPAAEAIASAFNAAVGVAPRDATVLCVYNAADRLGTILRWAPSSLICTNANNGTVETLISPDTWIGGDVCVCVVANGYPFNDEAAGSPPDVPYFVVSNMVTQERAMFDRMLARVGRFRGSILYDPSPPPPDNPQPDDPAPIHEALPPAGVFSSLCGGFPWSLVPVAGNQFPANNESAIRAAITSFFG